MSKSRCNKQTFDEVLILKAVVPVCYKRGVKLQGTLPPLTEQPPPGKGEVWAEGSVFGGFAAAQTSRNASESAALRGDTPLDAVGGLDMVPRGTSRTSPQYLAAPAA
eukprot:CAMPEP_0173395318 /NCGR_PEP_ID=MMETSP1356-20130122/31630_1 /TAXON_ID=77927 ORGANISM="Hemiselmis virescens, Strain PCC157" /NCGR_SAMPLE_ID=MMETSP1356 /ASSEMBLY_ACC=CAM_ASM_000847 /LENGTH=106 /DNA_ID=CAMNT_0014353997 /DNA_START=308 /DNA_END=626 /DNA_ORIENTATION=-